MKFFNFLLYIVLLFSFLSCGQKKTSEKDILISVIPKGTSHVFWQSVHAGAAKAAKEFKININWVGTDREDDRQQQIALIDNQVMNEVDGIVLAPLDAIALRRPVQNAANKGVPVIIIDSGLKDAEDIYTSFVATDNKEGGRVAARKLAGLLNGTGRVVLLRYNEGSASTENREEGFLEVMKEYAGIKIISSEQYAGVTRASAQQASENLLLRFSDAEDKLTIDGIFTPNISTTYGMLLALRRKKVAGTIAFVGFDSEGPAVEAVKTGEISGLVVQDPFKMGYLGVKTMVKKLNNEEVAKRIDTGVTFVEATDLERPEIKELVYPDLEKWLNDQ